MKYNKYFNLAISILLLLVIGYLFNKYKIYIEKDDKIEDLNIIKKYLLDNENSSIYNLSSIKKPIIWIHIEYDRNLRKWESFGSRSSNELNQDYLYLTLKSIIDKCNKDFHIVLIDDSSFYNLLDNWNVDMSKVSNIQKENIRNIALIKLLYKYGGIIMEPSFILFKSLKEIYDNILQYDKPCLGEFANESVESNINEFSPSLKFIGSIKNCPIIYELGKHLEIIVNNDHTLNSKFEGEISNWLYDKINKNEINYILGNYLGTRDSSNKKIGLDRLLSSTYLDLDCNSLGLYIPRKELLRRNVYNWFVYLDTNNVLKSNTNIGKYLLINN